MDKHDFYNAYNYNDKLKPGDEVKVEHSISLVSDKIDIFILSEKPLNQLKAMRDDSEFAEQKIFESMQKLAVEWEEQAANTALINKAIEYLETPRIQHTSNQWTKTEYDHHTISNAVYKMSYHIYEHKHYGHGDDANKPYAWDLRWSVYTQNPKDPQRFGTHIAGQERKHFTDKSAMEKYIQGRIKAYSHLFTEASPHIPKEYAHNFTVNGRLLPGYVIAAERTAEAVKDGKSKASLLGQLAANKADIKATGTPTKEKKIDRPEL